MDFLECSKEELVHFIKLNYLSLSTWDLTISGFDYSSDSDLSLFKVIHNDEAIALIEISNGMHENSIFIHNFEVFDKGKGIGSVIINKLKEDLKGVSIYLYATSPASFAFWKKQKFEGNRLLHFLNSISD